MLGVNRSDQLTAGVGSAEGTDHARRLSNVARYGTVQEADYTGATAGFPAIRVQLQEGEILTDWIPWFTPRAGNDRVWDPPEVGEVVMVLAPSGSSALASPSLACSATAMPTATAPACIAAPSKTAQWWSTTARRTSSCMTSKVMCRSRPAARSRLKLQAA